MASTRTFNLQPSPHWVVVDDFSRLPPGVVIYTYRSLNPSQFKPAFEDPAGTTPYGQPIQGKGNGTFNPIYWEFDTDFPDELYYIEVWSSEKNVTGSNAVLLWSVNNFSGESGSGGGGSVITTVNTIENLIVNGEFYRNIGSQPTTPGSLPTFLTIAPSNHAGIIFVNDVTNGPTAPDIIFAKNNTLNTDSITFPSVYNALDAFVPGLTNLTPNPTPSQYLNYTCTTNTGGETYKYFEFPIVQGLQNLTEQVISIKIYARLNSGTNNVTLRLRQFFGSGGAPSADVVTVIGGAPLGLDATWQPFIFNNVVVPSIGGKTLGSCGNDALFLQILLPNSALIDVDFSLPAVYLGGTTASINTLDFQSNDEIDAIVNSPRTGDVRTSLNTYVFGYVLMNDGTIGSALSLATARANLDTFPLYDLMWNTFVDSMTTQSYAPMADGIAYGASAVTDFTSNRALTLTRNVGRVMSGAGPIPISQAFTTPVANTLTVATTVGFIFGAPVTISGSSAPTILADARTYYVRILSSTTFSIFNTAEDAIANTNQITFAINTVTGTIIYPAHDLGSFFGNETHTQTIPELAAHTHTYSQTVAGGAFLSGGAGGQEIVGNTGSTGTGVPFNIMQPTVVMNVFIKL